VVQVVAGYEALIRPLFELASTAFEPDAFHRACRAVGRLIKSSSSDDLWYFRAGRHLVLMVSVGVEPTGRRGPLGQAISRPVQVRFGVLSFCGWETYSPADHPTEESHQAERAEFEAAFADALAHTVNALGEPLLEGRDADERGHQWAIWRGRTGLLVLQQSAYDPQFGLDINYWVCPWSGPDPKPRSPLVAWLTPIG
jgi:hypothetical protein